MNPTSSDRSDRSDRKRRSTPSARRGSGRPDPRRREADPARTVAYRVLRAVDRDGAYANLALSDELRSAGLSGRDAAFATELTAGTLRMRGLYDAVLAERVRDGLDSLEPEVLDLLRLGCHQILSLRVGAHAAVDETVRLCRSSVGPRPTGLVNAVLRRVAQRSRTSWVQDVAPDRNTDPIGWLAVAHSHPRWIVETFADRLGDDPGHVELEALLRRDNEPAVVSLCVRPGLAEAGEIDLPGARPAPWSPYGVLLDRGGDPGSLAGVREQRIGVQDEGSQLVAAAVAAAGVEPTEPDRRWLDLCAGPGGKAALSAALLGGRKVDGAVLTAVEPRPARAELVRRALVAAPVDVEVLELDGTDAGSLGGPYDRVLADVPCSGLGALRRRPEARWRRGPDDVTELRALQEALLSAAVDLARPGGVIGYITCSPLRAETRDVVDTVVAARNDVELVDARPLLGEVTGRTGTDVVLPELGDGPDVQLWPHRHGTDAMYLAVLRRTGPVA